MKTLIVSTFIYPKEGGTPFVVQNLGKQFEKDTFFVFGEQHFLWSAKKKIYEGVSYQYFWSGFSIKGKGYRFFMPFRWLFYLFILAKIKRIVKENKITHLIAVYPEPLYLLAASMAAKQLNIPFYTYFHNTYLVNMKGYRYFLAKKIQPYVFQIAKKNFVISDGMKSYMKKTYPSEIFETIPHSFESYPTETKQKERTVAKKIWRIVLFGNFNQSNVEATKRFVDTVKKDKRFSITIYTYAKKVFLKARGIDVNAINYGGYLPDEAFFDTISQYDIGVVTHGFTGTKASIEYQTIFPTRMIPMLLIKKPLLVHAPHDSFLATFVRENNCAALVDQRDSKAIIEQLEKIISDRVYAKELRDNAAKTAHLFYGKNIAQQLKAHLEDG